MKNLKKKYQLFNEFLDFSENIHHEIPYEILLSDLEITYEQFVKHLYKKYAIFDVPESFNKDNFFLLVDLLYDFQKQDLIDFLKLKGFLFSSEDIHSWLEYYFSIKMNYLNNHAIQHDSLEISIAGCKNPIDGFTLYYYNHIDEAKIIGKSAEIFLKKKNIKPNEFNLYILSSYIEENEKKHPFSKQCLDEFYKKLFKYCFENQILKKEEIEDDFNQYFKIKIDPITKEYLKILEIKNMPSSKKELKKIYYKLLKKYHPDKNSEGLEKTKLIIEAYEYLLQKYE